MRKAIKYFLGIFATMMVLPTYAFPCSEIYLEQQAMVSARTFDFPIVDGAIAIAPRGTQRISNVNDIKQQPFSWTSKYGSVIFCFQLPKKGAVSPVGKDVVLCGVDGINEYGFKVGTYYLGCSEYLMPDERPVLDAATWMQYYLDSFKTVEEAVQFAKDKKPYRVISTVNDSIEIKIHMYIHDKTGDSAILEYLSGEMKIYRNPIVTVLTNNPYEESLEELRKYNTFGGTEVIPGSKDSLDRFVRGAYYLKRAPDNKTKQEVVDNAIAIIQILTTPPIFKDEAIIEKFSCYTLWTIVTDIIDCKVYYRTCHGPNFKAIDLNDINFSEDQAMRFIPLAGNSLPE